MRGKLKEVGERKTQNGQHPQSMVDDNRSVSLSEVDRIESLYQKIFLNKGLPGQTE